MALIYDEIRGWIVVDDEPGSPPEPEPKPFSLETLYAALDKLEQGLIDKGHNPTMVQIVGRAIRGHVSTSIITDCSISTNNTDWGSVIKKDSDIEITYDFSIDED